MIKFQYIRNLLILCFLLQSSIYSQNIEDKVVEYKLDNGMKFLLMKRQKARETGSSTKRPACYS